MADTRQYFLNHVLTWPVAVELAVGGVAILLAHKAAVAFYLWFERRMALSGLGEESSDLLKVKTFLKVIRPLLIVLLLGIAFRLASHFNWPADALEVLFVLAFGLFLTRFLATPLKNRYWAGVLTAIIWIWVILLIFHFAEIGQNFLNSIDLSVGSVHVSMLTLGRAFFFSMVLYWLSNNLAASSILYQMNI